MNHALGRLAAPQDVDKDRVGEAPAGIDENWLLSLISASIHDLRTPLNAVHGWSQAFSLTGKATENPRESTLSLDRGVREMAELLGCLEDLLAALRGGDQAALEPVDLGSILEGLEQEFQAEVVAREMRLLLEIDHEARWVDSGELLLKRLLRGLLKKWIRLGTRGANLSIQARKRENLVCLTVAEAGAFQGGSNGKPSMPIARGFPLGENGLARSLDICSAYSIVIAPRLSISIRTEEQSEQGQSSLTLLLPAEIARE